MKKVETIRDFYKRIIGFIETDDNGNKIAKDFYHRVVARYDAKSNLTRDFFYRIIGTGDLTNAALFYKRDS